MLKGILSASERMMEVDFMRPAKSVVARGDDDGWQAFVEGEAATLVQRAKFYLMSNDTCIMVLHHEGHYVGAFNLSLADVQHLAHGGRTFPVYRGKRPTFDGYIAPYDLARFSVFADSMEEMENNFMESTT